MLSITFDEYCQVNSHQRNISQASQVKVRNLKPFKCYGSDNIQKQFESLILSQFKFFCFISKEIAKWLKYEINKLIMRQPWLPVNRKFEQKLCTRPEAASFRHSNRFFNNEYSPWRVTIVIICQLQNQERICQH